MWLGSEPQALIVIIFADVWKTAPFMALLILAGLQVIPGEVYEAAEVDGASTWQRFTRITLPLLTPAILVALIFRTLDALRIFDLPYVLTQGQNGTSTLSTIAQEAFATNRIYGLGSAMAVLTFIIVMIVSFSYIRFVGGNLRGLAEELGDGSRSCNRTQAATRARAKTRKKPRDRAKMPWWMWIVVAAIVVFCLFPFYWLINISLKTGNDLLSSSLFPPQPDARQLQGRSSTTPTSPRRCATARSSRSARRCSRSPSGRSAPTRWRG